MSQFALARTAMSAVVNPSSAVGTAPTVRTTVLRPFRALLVTAVAALPALAGCTDAVPAETGRVVAATPTDTLVTAAHATFHPAPEDPIAIALRAGRYRAARARLEAIPPDEQTPIDRFRLAIALLGTGEPAAADSILARVPVEAWQAPYRDYWRAVAHEKSGNVAMAAREFDSLAGSRAVPVGDSALVLALETAKRAGDTTIVARAIERLVARDDALAAIGLLERVRRRALTWRADWLKLLRDYPRAEKAYIAARFVVDSLVWTPRGEEIVDLASLWARHGDRGRAIRTWEYAMRDSSLAGRRGEFRFRIAERYALAREYDEAIPRLEALVADSSATARAWWAKSLRLLGLARRRSNDEPGSRAAERDFAARFPSHEEVPDAVWNIGMSWERDAKLDSAIATYDLLAARFPRNATGEDAAWRSGFCRFRRGEYAQALAQFSRLAREATGFAVADQAGYWEGKTLLRLDRDSAAMAAWERTAQFSPRSYYAVIAAYAANLPITAPDDERPLERRTMRAPADWPGYTEARWLSLLGRQRWARAVLAARTRGMADSVDEREDLADAFESLADYPTALKWRWQAMWRRTTEAKYHLLPPATLRRIWPDFFRREVTAAADESDIEREFVWSIIRQESVFDPDVTSGADARGLMQLIPPTAYKVARSLRIANFDPGDLYDPELNVRLGTRYLADLLNEFGGKIDYVAAGYNGGPANVDRWRRSAEGDHDLFRELITYAETRKYVKLVVKNYLVYRSLYPHEGFAAGDRG